MIDSHCYIGFCNLLLIVVYIINYTVSDYKHYYCKTVKTIKNNKKQ